MLDFLTLEPEAYGLDISDLSLKIAKLKKRRKFLNLASWGEVGIKPGIIEQGELLNEDVLSKIIKQGLSEVKGEKLRTRNVIASLPEQKAFFQIIQLPKMKKEELKTAVPFEAENYIPLPIKEVYLDFQVIPPARADLNRLDILIVAIPKKTVDPYVSCFKKAGLVPLALEIESQSIVRALIKDKVSPFPVFIIDFGKSRASFIIFSGFSLRFTSSISISSQKLTEAISQSLKVDLAEAEKLKLDHGLRAVKRGSPKPGEEAVEGKKIFDAMSPVLTDLVSQIRKYIRYYHTHIDSERLSLESGKIKKILLCGRGANLRGLTDFLSFEFKIPVELGNPWINILPEPLKEVPGLSFKKSLGYTTALGLAIRGIKQKP